MSQLQNHSSGKITFSWEKKPGVSKEITNHGHENLIQKELLSNNKLPPPPASSAEAANTTSTPARNLVHDFQIPLPPCPFQPPYYRTSSKKGLWIQDDDPFLAAYKECTKNQKGANKKLTKFGGRNSESRFWKSLSFFSCPISRSSFLLQVSRFTISQGNRSRHTPLMQITGFVNVDVTVIDVNVVTGNANNGDLVSNLKSYEACFHGSLVRSF